MNRRTFWRFVAAGLAAPFAPLPAAVPDPGDGGMFKDCHANSGNHFDRIIMDDVVSPYNGHHCDITVWEEASDVWGDIGPSSADTRHYDIAIMDDITGHTWDHKAGR
jgi:hypothetical protein